MDSHHAEAGKAREAFRAVTRDVAWVTEAPKPHKAWLAALGVALVMLAIGLYSIYVLVTTGIGVWGNSNTVCWAWDITNFVWWIGIGHAGTLISAVLYLTRRPGGSASTVGRGDDDLRRDVRRLVPAAPHRPAVVRVVDDPHPNDMQMWPQFRSPLMWDVFAVTTYMPTSILFWYMGMVPTSPRPRPLRGEGDKLARSSTAPLSLGWRGSARQWHRYERAYLILAGLATRWSSRSTRSSVRLRDLAAAGLAHDDLPAVLRRRRIFSPVRDGVHAADPGAPPVQPQAHHQGRARRGGLQDHARDRHDGRPRLRDRVLHRLVLGQPVRELHVHQPRVRRSGGRTS
jgi:hypothetical protein